MKVLPPIQLAQVLSVRPLKAPERQSEQIKLVVELESGNILTVRPIWKCAKPSSFQGELPRQGTWGLVLFARDDMQTGYWLGEIADVLRNALPLDVWLEDIYARINHRSNNVIDIEFADGSIEKQFPDGSLWRVTHGKDGSVSNEELKKKKTELGVTREENQTQVRKPFTPDPKPPQDIYLKTPNCTIEVSADGRVRIETGDGHKIAIENGREKARDNDGSVVSSPEEAAGREISGIYIETESGHKISLKDSKSDKKIVMESSKGHTLTLQDAPESKVVASTKRGRSIELVDSPQPKTVVKTPLGRSITLDDVTQKTVLRDLTGVVIESFNIKLGGEAASLPVLIGPAGPAGVPSVTTKAL